MPKSLMRVAGVASLVDRFRGAKRKYSTNDKWIVEAGAHYSLYVEVGTSTHEAQPYMAPAIASVKPRAGKIIKDNGLEDGLEIIAKEIKKEAKQNAPVDTGHLKANISVIKEQ